MPYSSGENVDLFRQFLADNNIHTVLDVGAGSGTYARVGQHLNIYWEAVEVWQPYIDQFNLDSLYQRVHHTDIREFVPIHDYDLVIFGDILEHMSEDDALQVWRYASTYSKWGWISLPIVHYPQGAEFDNPYEVHVQDHIDPARLTDKFGPFDIVQEYDVTGTYVKRFK